MINREYLGAKRKEREVGCREAIVAVDRETGVPLGDIDLNVAHQEKLCYVGVGVLGFNLDEKGRVRWILQLRHPRRDIEPLTFTHTVGEHLNWLKNEDTKHGRVETFGECAIRGLSEEICLSAGEYELIDSDYPYLPDVEVNEWRGTVPVRVLTGIDEINRRIQENNQLLLESGRETEIEVERVEAFTTEELMAFLIGTYHRFSEYPLQGILNQDFRRPEIRELIADIEYHYGVS